jgi:hypothetical protein
MSKNIRKWMSTSPGSMEAIAFFFSLLWSFWVLNPFFFSLPWSFWVLNPYFSQFDVLKGFTTMRYLGELILEPEYVKYLWGIPPLVLSTTLIFDAISGGRISPTTKRKILMSMFIFWAVVSTSFVVSNFRSTAALSYWKDTLLYAWLIISHAKREAMMNG